MKSVLHIADEAVPGDVGDIIALHGKIYRREYGWNRDFELYVAKGLIELYENYSPDLERIWVCKDGDKVVGSLALVNRGAGSGQLRFFLVDPEYRGRGIGKKLLRLFNEFLIDKGYRYAYLWTTSELEMAAKLYRDAGFRLCEEKAGPAFGTIVTEQKYELFLTDNA